MSNDIEKLPAMLARAAATLERATSAGEILEATECARITANLAKQAERLAKMRHAHATIINAIRETQAGALEIEARAQCRLADEYDAAQARGEIASHGGVRKAEKSSFQHGKLDTAVAGIGAKTICEARKIRDAEKAQPGIVSKTLKLQLEADQELSMAAVKRTIKAAKAQRQPGVKQQQVAVDLTPQKWQQFKAAAKKEGKSAAAKVGELIDPPTKREDLSPSAQQRFDAAIRQFKQQLAAQFAARVREGVRECVDEMVLPHWKKQIEQAHTLYKNRRGLMDKDTFNKIRRVLHPDSRNSVSDRMLVDAFNAFMAMEKYLLNEKDSPTNIGPLPDNLAAWDKMRAAATAARKHKANGNHQPLRRQ